MDTTTPGLAFEQPIHDLEARLRKLQQSVDKSPPQEDEIRRLRRELAAVTKKIYSNLTPWETVLVARANDRPHTADYLALIFDEFMELFDD